MGVRDIEDRPADGVEAVPFDEKKNAEVDVRVVHPDAYENIDAFEKEEHMGQTAGIEATGADLAIAEEKLSTMSLEQCKDIMMLMRKLHQHDQNFPAHTLEQMDKLLDDPDVTEHPERHLGLIHAMKLEAILSTEHSPYAEVRAVTSAEDDPSLPSLTFRVWVIGILFSGAGAFINQLFEPRMPAVSVEASVGQLLAFPLGKFMERVLPTRKMSLFGRSFTLNPGPFNKKEHMLITVMCTIAFSTPYAQSIIFIQALEQFYNQPYAYKYGYQILNTLGINCLGYGLAGLCRPFVIHPSFAIWPEVMPTLALNQAFHAEGNTPVPGPFRRIYTWSRYKFFLVAFTAMFCYFWFPNFIFQALSYFSWMTWIAPNNMTLTAITGVNNGLGVNPIPTFDWNIFRGGALTNPVFSLVTQLLGMIASMFVIIIFYWTNAFNTSYLPINSNRTFDNHGHKYNVSRVLDANGNLDFAKYNEYSEAWMSAGNLVVYMFFFASYTAMLTYAALYHRHDLAQSFRLAAGVVKKRWGRKGNVEAEEQAALTEDVHYRLMQKYKEVPEWWYLTVLLIAFALGIAGVAAYPTGTSPAVVLYGLAIALIFTVPCAVIQSVTGVPVTMNVLAEFIGGSIVPGNAISMCYFKSYGVETSLSAVHFLKDLKLAHYTHINPRHTFIAQIVATLVSSFVCSALYNFILGFDGICTPDAVFKLSCPGENTFFTAAVFWGTINPKRVFGVGSHFKTLLIGFPLGIVIVLIGWGLRKMFPKNQTIRAFHPVAFVWGGVQWAPYNLIYSWPTVVVTWFSFKVIRPRWLSFWAKYNYVLPAAFNSGIAIATIIMFFALAIPGKELVWRGNEVVSQGCEGAYCVLKEIPEKGYFGPDPGSFH